MRTNGGTTAPFGHVMPVAFPRANADQGPAQRRQAAASARARPAAGVLSAIPARLVSVSRLGQIHHTPAT